MFELMQCLSLIGLVVGTTAYALIVRRRTVQRKALNLTADIGLQGLVRVFLVDGAPAGSVGAYVPE